MIQVQTLGRRLLTVIVFTALYYLAGKLGLALAFVHDSARAVWPPSGIALAALLGLGSWLWPGIFLGALLVNLDADQGNFATSLGIAAGNTLEALAAAWLLRRFAGGRRVFEQPLGVFRFAALSGIASPMISATIGVTSLWLGGFVAPGTWPQVWENWWLGDMGGIVILTPMLILWWRDARIDWGRARELLALVLCMVLVCELVFGELILDSSRHYPIGFLCIVPLLWAAFRFGPRETATLLFPMAIIAVARTVADIGPFAGHPETVSLPVLVAFLGTFGIASLAVAAGVIERQRTAAVLAENEDRLRAIFQQTTVGIAQVDRDGTLGVMNERFGAIAGSDPARLAGTRFEELVHPEERDRWREQFARVGTAGHGVHVEHRWVRPDGTIAWVDVSLSAVSDDDARPRFAVAIVQDVSERRDQEQLKRTLELRMQQTQKLESLGVLAGGIAHDFNNLLTGIMGHANLASLDLDQNHPVQGSLRAVVAASERAAALTRQMLAYSGKAAFEIRPVNLSSQVREVLGLLAISVHKQVELRPQLAEPIPMVEADVGQLHQVVMNLVLNAAEAIPERGTVVISTGTVVIEPCQVHDYLPAGGIRQGNYVFLEVQDNGRGMDEATRARMFEPFFTTKFAGRGLGLAAVLGIVRGHRGGLRVTSAPGQGTTFRVLFPVAAASGGEATSPPDGDLRGNARVLVIDDEDVVRELAQRGLERYGYRVLGAVNGRHGLALAAQSGRELDVVVMDMTMPDLSGMETFVELRRIAPGLPVILSSGYDESEALSSFRALGLAGFVQKPYTPPELARVVKQVLGARVSR